MSGIWLPGIAGPVDDLIARIQRRVERFAVEHGVTAMVEVELPDGALIPLESLSPEPGYGFLTLLPHPEEEGEEPRELIIPVAAIRQITIRPVEPHRARFGFSAPET